MNKIIFKIYFILKEVRKKIYTDTVAKLTNHFIATVFSVLKLSGGGVKMCVQSQLILILSS